MKHLKRIHVLMIFIVACAYNSVYSLAFMKSLYYQLMQSGLSLSHFRLGQLYSIYGLFSMFSYLFGAFFLSRFRFWKLVAGSLAVIGVLTLFLAFLPPYPVMILIFGVIGFLLGAVFYPAHLQILHSIGAPFCQGSVFSLFYAFNGILGILFAALGFQIAAAPADDPDLVRLLFIFFAVLNLISALCAAIVLRKLQTDASRQAPVCREHLRKLLHNKKLWIVILIVFTNYIGFSGLNYILLFLDSVYEIPVSVMNLMILMRTYLIAIVAAPVAGKITDHFHSAARLMKYSFLLNTAVTIGMLLFYRQHFIVMLACIFLSCLFINMGKSMSLITIDEAGIPPVLYGISISFISFCAYSPDAFYYSLSGFLLDHFPDTGYQIVFFLVAAVSLLGYVCSRILEKSNKGYS